jgi:hypothetical protein
MVGSWQGLRAKSLQINGWRSCITQIYNNLIKIGSRVLIYKTLKINTYAGANNKLRKNYQLIDG